MTDGALHPKDSRVPSSPLECLHRNGRCMKVKGGIYERHEWVGYHFDARHIT
jgi:hypothetical protein